MSQPFRIYNPETDVPVIKNNTNKQIINSTIGPAGPTGPTGPSGGGGGGGDTTGFHTNFQSLINLGANESFDISLSAAANVTNFALFTASGVIETVDPGNYSYNISVFSNSDLVIDKIFDNVNPSTPANFTNSFGFSCLVNTFGLQTFKIRITNTSSSIGNITIRQAYLSCVYR